MDDGLELYQQFLRGSTENAEQRKIIESIDGDVASAVEGCRPG
jgi:hypothetical protein